MYVYNIIEEKVKKSSKTSLSQFWAFYIANLIQFIRAMNSNSYCL